MELNNLNIPPNEEPISKKISRIANQLIVPVLLPASSFFVGWLVQKRISVQLDQLRKEQEQHADLKKDVNTLQTQTDIPMPQDNYKNEQTIRQRQLAMENITQEEEKAAQKIFNELDELTPLLRERQRILCNPFQYREHRFQVEEKLKTLVYSKSYDKDLGLFIGLQDILKNDKHCGDPYNAGGRRGCLMWVYLDFWKTQAELMKYKHILERMKNLDDS